MTFNRREALGVGAAALAALATRRAFAADPKPPATAMPGNGAHIPRSLADALTHCIEAGEYCVSHCSEEFSRGNTTMASCDRRVHEMLATCRALLSLATLDSSLTPQMASVCAAACKACSEACAEHKAHFLHGMHLACKECMEACDACEKACLAIAK